MTAPALLIAARNARYLLAVYGQFGRPMPIACAETVLRELTDALELCGDKEEKRPVPFKWVRVPGGKMWMDIEDWIGQ